MRVQTMRKIDYFVGIPLCFLASIVQRVLNLFQGVQHIHPKKVLFIELSETTVRQKARNHQGTDVPVWPVTRGVFSWSAPGA